MQDYYRVIEILETANIWVPERKHIWDPEIKRNIEVSILLIMQTTRFLEIHSLLLKQNQCGHVCKCSGPDNSSYRSQVSLWWKTPTRLRTCRDEERETDIDSEYWRVGKGVCKHNYSEYLLTLFSLLCYFHFTHLAKFNFMAWHDIKM